MVTLNKWYKSYDNDKEVNIIYTDFAKAFDKVSHKKLIQVLYSFGIRGNLLEWLNQFLVNRRQQVYINSVYSESLDVKSGVPQGSVLGPLLFILYINDIINVCSAKCFVAMFADDCKFYSEDADALQSTMDNITKYTKERQISLAEQKCVHLQISKKPSSCTFRFDTTAIAKVRNVKDLGVIISSDLKWKEHVNEIKSKGMIRCHHILKSFKTNNIWTLMKAFQVYVRPILEYSSSTWNPFLSQDVQAVEYVQRFYTRRVFRRCKIPFNSYEDRLMKLGIQKLSTRRENTDNIITYKMLHNLVDIPYSEFFQYRNNPYSLRGHGPKLTAPKRNSNVARNCFGHRIVKPWNSLPREVVNSESLETFKTKLKKINKI